MGAEIPSSSELIVACMGDFSPQGVTSLQIGDAVARACKTPMRLRHQHRELIVRTLRNCPHGGSIAIMAALRNNWRGGGVWFPLRRVKGTAGLPDFFCVRGTKRSFFSFLWQEFWSAAPSSKDVGNCYLGSLDY